MEIFRIIGGNRMKIIDLLNKIANGEDVPKKIHIRDLDKYTWQEDVKAYWSDVDENDLLSDLDLSATNLKEDIDIIEEPQKHKIPEKLDKRDFLNNETLDQVDADLDFIIDKINEILDYLEEIE
jgi:hypothetical protein